MIWKCRRSRFQNRGIGIDPLADWLFRPGGRGRDTSERLHVLIRLAKEKSALDFADFNIDGKRPSDSTIVFDNVTAKQWRDSIEVPPLYLDAKGGWKAARYCTARIEPVVLGWLADYPEAKAFVDSITISAAPTPVRLQSRKPFDPGGGVRTRADAVVMGLIDDGFCMASERFRTRNGKTRVLGAWLQHFDGAGLKPRQFEYGREINETEINDSLEQPDEDAFYRDIQLFDPRFDEAFWPHYRASHATHVMDVATGFNPKTEPGVGRRRPIVAVQLPDVVVADGSGHSLGSFVLDGLRYIASRVEGTSRRAAPAPAPVPAVVNISYGNNAGPHDGSSDIERAMSEVIDIWSGLYPKLPFVIVLPAGNSYQSEGHARLAAKDLANDCAKTLAWQIQPDDGTASLVQFWLPPGFPRRKSDQCSLQIMTPQGTSEVISTSGTNVAELVDDDGTVLAQALYCPPSRGQERGMFQICVAPTVDPVTIGQSGKGPAPHGLWRLSVTASGLAADAEIHAWIQRDDLLRRSAIVGRQSRFGDERYELLEGIGHPGENDHPQAYVKRSGSLNAIATGHRPVVAGAYHERVDMDGRWPKMAHYSGGGDSGCGSYGVDVAAVAEDSIVLAGVVGAGTRSAARIRMNGTSVAAPELARAIADNIDLFRGLPAKEAIPLLLGKAAQKKRHPRKGWGYLGRRLRESPY